MRIRTTVAAAALAVVAPVIALAPRSGTGASVEQLVARCRETGLSGRELADEAITAVAEAFPHYSLWHVWEKPETALRNGRGWSHQYNTVLFLVLRELGFETRAVHAARVRGFKRPWWLVGHAWVKVVIDGRPLDACASRAANRVGTVLFVPLTPELPLRRVTRWAVAAAVTPFVVAEVWRAWLTGREVPPHIYSKRP